MGSHRADNRAKTQHRLDIREWEVLMATAGKISTGIPPKATRGLCQMSAELWEGMEESCSAPHHPIK